MLVKNAQNLMRAVIKTVQAAEAACMRVCSHCFLNNSLPAATVECVCINLFLEISR